jgi:outer membrane protein assembly factor BamB
LLLVWFPAGYLSYGTQSEIAWPVVVLTAFSLVTLPLAVLLWRGTIAPWLSACALGAFVVVTVATGYSRGVQGALMVLVLLLIAPLAIALWSVRPVPRRWFAAGLVAGWAGLAVTAGRLVVSAYVVTHGPVVVVAFDAATGRHAWTATFDDAGGASPPATWGGMVFVQTGRSYESTAGTVVALDARTGRRAWAFDTDAAPATCGGALSAGDVSGATPVIAAGVVVARARSGQITGLNARDGRVLWRTHMEGAPAAAADGIAVIASSLTYTAVDPATGAVRWTANVADAAWGDSTRGKQAFVLGAGSVVMVERLAGEGRDVIVLDSDNGHLLWDADVGYLDSPLQRYASDGRHVLVAVEVGRVVTTRDARTGEVLHRSPALPPNSYDYYDVGVAADAGHAYYSSMVAGLTAVDPASSTDGWKASFTQDPHAMDLGAPTPYLTAGDNLVVVHHVSRVSAFDASTGRQRWTAKYDPKRDTSTLPAVGEHLVMLPRSGAGCMAPGTSG